MDLIGVVGAGTMGAGIAQACLQGGVEVALYDVSPEALDAGERRILSGLERLERPELFSMVRRVDSPARLSRCDAVIEAIVEDLGVKRELFAQLDRLVEPPRLLATSTSSFLVGRVAAATEFPERVVGMHFFRPAQVTALVEVVRAEHGSDEAVRRAVRLVRALGKTPVVCGDRPGFIADRVARPFYLSGMRLLEEGRGTPADIDRALRQAGLRMGPFELMDGIGLEVDLAAARGLWEALGKPERLAPRRIQEQLVAWGRRGRKNACGFYVYGENPPGTINPDLEELVPGLGKRPLAPADVVRTVVGAVLDEAKLAAEERVGSPSDIDIAMRLGFGWPRGPFEWEREIAA
ncbi:MAG: 3-hydroxyacyl-CoA dehydrogenase NAD-binding domain-containing protein [Elusimicrobia bacterium]|nr:3-hydroxyacyl-CoA dehydrogenase NAD-binding domain-containing protein [Elusimicrobiota bacterium]